MFEDTYTATADIQIRNKEKIQLDQNKVFMWIFDYYANELTVKDIVEISDYEITIDEETNAKSTFNVLKKTNAKAKDIVAIKKNNEVVYWGIIDEIQNEDGELKNTFITKYITNLFDRKIEQKSFSSGTGLWTIFTTISSNRYYVTSDVAGSPVRLAQATTPTLDNMVYLIKFGSYYVIRSAKTGEYFTRISRQPNDWVVTQAEFTGSDDQLWQFGGGLIRSKATGDLMAYWSNQGIVVLKSILDGGFTVGLTQYDVMQLGIEDSLDYIVDHNFVNTDDSLVNIGWLTHEAQSHTPRQVQITNVENRIYNLHTWLTNCNQYYDVTYNFSVVKYDKWYLKMGIKVYEEPKQLIDANAQNISNYTEVFETNVMAKVIVLYDKRNEVDNPGTYTLYLKTDRTTTTNMNDANRAEGNITTVHTENYEDANQTALDEMKANEYNHNITFSYNKYIKQGTPIAIKTKESLIFNTYISSIKITPKAFYEYICGNIRINFIDKLKKEKV